MEFRILGPLEIRNSEGKQLSLGAGRQRTLLAVLLLHANEVVSTDRLIDGLWGEKPPETAAKALQGYVSQLRKALNPSRERAGDVLLTRAPGYLLRVEPDELDAFRFERLLADGRRALAVGEAKEASATLREALSLWGGPALAEFAFEAFSQGEIKRLEELRLAGLECRIEADLALGRHGEVIAELEALVAQHPLRERLRGQLMLSLYRGGRQGEALQQYQRARHVLIDELGLEPSDALQRLQRSILTHDPSLEPPVVAGARNASLAAAMRGQARAAALPARSSRRSGAPLPPNSVALIDLEENKIVGHVPVGWRPVAVAVGHASVWVANADDGTLSRIDPDSRTVTRTIGIGAPAIDVAIGPDSVWVANGSDGTLSRVDPNTEVVVDTIDLRGENDLAPNTTYAVAVDGDTVWVATGPRSLVRIDPATNEPAAVIDVGHIPVSVAVYEGAVWVATVAERALRIEERTQALTAATAVGFPVALAAGEGGVWIVDGRGSVWHIDPDTAAVMQTISVGRGSVGLTAGAGGVWVANNANGTILRIDPSTDQVVATIEVGHAPTAVALGEGVGWVSIQSESAI